jgi:glycosyltransferase domain-containing protein
MAQSLEHRKRSNCSIIIPTYNRPHYLKRILCYYDKYGRDFEIIVADSSSDENKLLNKEIISSFPKLKVKYIGKYPPTLSSYHKMADAFSYVKRKYCAVCADDDFTIPNGIRKAVDFLEQNPDFTVVHGYYISFHFEDKNGKKQFCLEQTYPHQSVEFSDAAERLSYYLAEYPMTVFYAVQRASLSKRFYRELINSKANPLLFGEMLPSVLAVLYGKMKCLDVLYAVRDKNSATSPPSSKIRAWPSLVGFMRAGTYDGEYSKFRDCLAIHLSRKSSLTIEASKKIVDDAMHAYVNKYYPNDFKNILRYTTRDLLLFLRLPEKFNSLAKKLYWKIFAKKCVYSTPKILANSRYHRDFDRVRSHVMSFSG